MSILAWTLIWVFITFSIYIGIAIWTRVSDTRGFYVAGQGVPALANGAATAADWMSAASFISMAGMISFMGYDGSVYILGWTGGYVLLALLLAPFLRKFGKFTVPDFVGERYYSNSARIVAAVAALFVSFTYVAGQMRGVGVVFSRFLEVEVVTGVIIGVIIVAMYAVLGGMKGITYTQMAQYVVLIFAYTIPAIAIAFVLSGNFIPHLAIADVLPQLEGLSAELGLASYSSPFTTMSKLNVLCITVALMVGTAGLPHVIVRFYTVKTVKDARWSAGWALLFIAILYSTAPAIAMFAKTYILQRFADVGAMGMLTEGWIQSWAPTGLIAIEAWTEGISASDLLATIDRDIIVLATPEIANLSNVIIGLVAAGALAAALSTASGLLLVISSSLAHDIYGEILNPKASDKNRLMVGRIMILLAVLVAGYFGVNPPGFVAEVVAFAFGLAAASFFPVIVLGIFWKRANKQAAIAGMSIGLLFTVIMILIMRSQQLFGIEPMFTEFLGVNAQGIGTIGMLINFAVMIVVSLMTAPPPQSVQDLVESVRYPRVLTDAELTESAQNN